MTAIIALKHGKQIVMAADGRTSNDTEGWPISNEERFKIQRVNGSPNCIIGCSGDCDRNFIIKNIPNLLNGKKDVNYAYVVNKVLPKIYHALFDANLIKEQDNYLMIGSGILLATSNHLFKISPYGVVMECKNAAICGSGDDMLICKYLTLKDSKTPIKEQAVSCLKHAIKYGQSIGYPITILTNDENVPLEVINS